MRELVLHIGRHKTGTTAIQHFLSDNRLALQKVGYYVPLAGKVNAGHHGFSTPLQVSHLAEKPLAVAASSLVPFQRLRDELQQVDSALSLAVSSEAFQNCDPVIVREAFADYDVRIVVYLRNQLEYLASAYAQRVHATDYAGTLAEFFTDVFNSGIAYRAFLQDWHEAFPRDFVVRRYDRTTVVDDFVHHGLRLLPVAWTKRVEPSNPSLNARITEFKRQLNLRELDDKPAVKDMYFVLPSLNEVYPSDKVRVSADIAATLIQRCSASDGEVAERYFGEARLFDYASYSTGAAAQLSEAEFDAIYASLKERIPRETIASAA